MNRNDVIDVLTAITAGDRRTIGESDIVFWCEIIGDLPKDIALQAVADHFRSQPGVWLEPGHVVQRAGEIRRDQLDRTPIDADDVYPGDVKTAQDPGHYPHDWTAEQRVSVYWYAVSLRAMPATTVGWGALAAQLLRERERRENPAGTGSYGNLLTVRCPWCHASPGQHCTVPQTKRRPHGGAHPSRIEAATEASRHSVSGTT